MSRFFLLRWRPCDSQAAHRASGLAQKLIASGGWRALIHWRGIFLLAQEDVACAQRIDLGGGWGFIFGPIYDTDGRSVLSFAARGERLVRDGGEALIADHWGAYIAFLIDRASDDVHIIREPLGAAPCFWSFGGGLVSVFSHVSDHAALAVCDIDHAQVAAFLAFPFVSSDKTAIATISELMPGHRLTLSRTGCRTDTMWRPPREAFDAFRCEKACELRQVVVDAIGARTRGAGQIIHRLSGGLDSSIVLASLVEAHGPERILAVNDASSLAPEGDERMIARAVATHFGVRYAELSFDPARTDYSRLLDAPLSSSPGPYDLSAADRTYESFLAGERYDLVTSGQGGDQIFHRVRTPLIVADAMRAGAPHALSLVREVATLTGFSFWRVLREAARHGWGRAPLRLSDHFMAESSFGGAERLNAAIAQHMRHDWLADWRKRPPNQVRRTLSIIHAIHYHQAWRGRRINLAPVLISQPIVEWAMRQPAHHLLEGGVDRALYRSAFKNILPNHVVTRVTKGETTRHFAAVVRANRDFCNDVLRNGELVGAGLANSAEIDQLLRSAEHLELRDLNQMLNLIVAEAWMRRWKRHRVETQHISALAAT